MALCPVHDDAHVCTLPAGHAGAHRIERQAAPRPLAGPDLAELAQRAARVTLAPEPSAAVIAAQGARLLPYLRQASGQGAAAERAAVAPLVAALLAALPNCELAAYNRRYGEAPAICAAPATRVYGGWLWCAAHAHPATVPVPWFAAVQALEQHFAPRLVVERQGAPCPEAR